MAVSVFDDKSRQPGDEDLAMALGHTFILWNDLKKLIALRFEPVTVEWGFATKKTGWGLRLKKNKRTIMYMTPCEGYFLASFVLGEKAVKAAHDGHLPDSILHDIDNAKKYVEGRGVRFEVRNAEDISNMEKLAMIKMAN